MASARGAVRRHVDGSYRQVGPKRKHLVKAGRAAGVGRNTARKAAQ